MGFSLLSSGFPAWILVLGPRELASFLKALLLPKSVHI